MVVVDGNMHANFDMKHLYFYILMLLWYFTFLCWLT